MAGVTSVSLHAACLSHRLNSIFSTTQATWCLMEGDDDHECEHRILKNVTVPCLKPTYQANIRLALQETSDKVHIFT